LRDLEGVRWRLCESGFLVLGLDLSLPPLLVLPCLDLARLELACLSSWLERSEMALDSASPKSVSDERGAKRSILISLGTCLVLVAKNLRK